MTSSTPWHPLLATVEPEPGLWLMLDSLGRPYGLVRVAQTPDGLRFKTVHAGVVIGWASSLRAACERIHQAELSQMTSGYGSGVPVSGAAEGRAAAVATRAAWAAEVEARYRS